MINTSINIIRSFFLSIFIIMFIFFFIAAINKGSDLILLFFIFMLPSIYGCILIVTDSMMDRYFSILSNKYVSLLVYIILLLVCIFSLSVVPELFGLARGYYLNTEYISGTIHASNILGSISIFIFLIITFTKNYSAVLPHFERGLPALIERWVYNIFALAIVSCLIYLFIYDLYFTDYTRPV